ncbi:hypothetical protein HMN09_01174800 [Mycena chlorophos]|uniref:MYND-type domain-containing protein n=1 Tax=Mycena chlorophos TaxID=658473 RepID=A0A8H6VVU8_MYCCL|nr:hypothetical protein HMN09_01174800 [Mycena chlorophos]
MITVLCNKSGDKAQMKYCGGCRSTYYCSRACQRADWRDHKDICADLREFKHFDSLTYSGADRAFFRQLMDEAYSSLKGHVLEELVLMASRIGGVGLPCIAFDFHRREIRGEELSRMANDSTRADPRVIQASRSKNKMWLQSMGIADWSNKTLEYKWRVMPMWCDKGAELADEIEKVSRLPVEEHAQAVEELTKWVCVETH